MLLIPGEDGKWIEMKEYTTISVQSKEELETLMKCAEFQWRPVSEELPGEGELVIVSLLEHEWISDYDSKWVPEEKKIHYAERQYVTLGFVIDMSTSRWRYLDQEDLMIMEANKKEERSLSYPCREVIAWIPLPEPFRDLEGKQHGKTNI